MQNNYLIPANSKRGSLIFGWFRPVDLIIFGIGVGTTLLMLLLFSSSDSIMMVVILIPAFIAAGLVMPIPNQHNVLVLLGAILKFFTSQQRYKWKGWSIYESFK